MNNTIKDIFLKRYSCKNYSDKMIDNDILSDIIYDASLSASSFNEQPWRLIFGIKNKNKFYEIFFESLSEKNKQWNVNVQVLVLSLFKKSFSRNNQPNSFAFYDLGQFIASFSLSASLRNLHVHQMGGFNPEFIRNNIKIPENYELGVIFSLGYSDDIPPISKNRKSINDISSFNDEGINTILS